MIFLALISYAINITTDYLQIEYVLYIRELIRDMSAEASWRRIAFWKKKYIKYTLSDALKYIISQLENESDIQVCVCRPSLEKYREIFPSREK